MCNISGTSISLFWNFFSISTVLTIPGIIAFLKLLSDYFKSRQSGISVIIERSSAPPIDHPDKALVFITFSNKGISLDESDFLSPVEVYIPVYNWNRGVKNIEVQSANPALKKTIQTRIDSHSSNPEKFDIKPFNLENGEKFTLVFTVPFEPGLISKTRVVTRTRRVKPFIVKPEVERPLDYQDKVLYQYYL